MNKPKYKIGQELLTDNFGPVDIIGIYTLYQKEEDLNLDELAYVLCPKYESTYYTINESDLIVTKEISTLKSNKKDELP
jgi:hypothetical protein